MEDRATREVRFLWWRFTLREGLLLAFCATFIVLTRASLRLHLGLPGHAMFFLIFFLIMARGCVPKVGAPTLVGLISGLVALLLGMTKAGPLVLTNFVLPAIIVDLAGALYPRMVTSHVACVIVGIVASAFRGFTSATLDYLMGMETEIAVRHVLVTMGSGAIFAVLGASLVPPVIRRLQANNLIPTRGL